MSQANQFHINRSLSCYGLFCKLFTEDENNKDFEYFEVFINEDDNGKHHDNCKCELCFGLIMYNINNDGYNNFPNIHDYLSIKYIIINNHCQTLYSAYSYKIV